MISEFMILFRDVLRKLRVGALALLLVMSVGIVACSEDKVDSPPTNLTEGVELPVNQIRTCGGNSATIKITVKTSAGYKIDVDDSEMIVVRSNSSVAEAGTYSVDLQISRNNTGKERSGIVYITVSGYSRIKLVEIVQSVGSTDKVVQWIDERLQEEYYWLDEYKEKLHTYDYSLAYDKFLSSTLLSLTTNMDDGGVDKKGNRYIYSHITREHKDAGTSSHTRAEERAVRGFGIKLSRELRRTDSNLIGFSVEHVYPSSPAANAGVKRGDIIFYVNGNNISINDLVAANELWSLVNDNIATTITIEGTTLDYANNKEKSFKYTLAANTYEENPVAYSAVLTFDKEVEALINPDGRKKIGHLVYLSFESSFDKELADAIEELASKGITDLILDLRTNGGGSVNSSVALSSMILPESYIGKTYAKLVRNPQNTTSETEEVCPIVRNGFGSISSRNLPNLNLEKLWVITSASTASASEMVINGLRGLDVEVKMVGKTTEGKNCGMDVMERVFDSYVYTYAPITFLNENAKGHSDFSDGIKPDIDFDDYVVKDTSSETDIQRACRLFPMPQVEWWDMKHDFATYETAMRICGFTLTESNEQGGTEGESGTGSENGTGSGATSALFKPYRSVATTRAAGHDNLATMEVVGVIPGVDMGATLTEREREELREVRKQ